jgi:hypothetical protein
MTYAVYDFSESLAQAEGFSRADVESVVAAWGENGDFAEWSGGFVLRLKDGRFAYIEGWCDTTGWGCQDGVETTLYDAMPAVSELQPMKAWDHKPEDLAKYLRGEIPEWA